MCTILFYIFVYLVIGLLLVSFAKSFDIPPFDLWNYHKESYWDSFIIIVWPAAIAAGVMLGSIMLIYRTLSLISDFTAQSIKKMFRR